MSDKQSIADSVVAQLNAAGLGAVTTKAMFGGISIRVDDAEMGKVTKDAELQLRSDAEVESVFTAAGDVQVTNSFGGDTPRKMPYFIIAEANQGSLGDRMKASVDAGKRAAAAKAAKKKK